MTAPTEEKWDPRRETYDAFCDRQLRDLALRGARMNEAQRATQAQGRAVKPGGVAMASPGAAPRPTGLRAGVSPGSRLARVLAEGLVHIAERRAAEEAESAEHPKEERLA